jgi:hypothetical protein
MVEARRAIRRASSFRHIGAMQWPAFLPAVKIFINRDCPFHHFSGTSRNHFGCHALRPIGRVGRILDIESPNCNGGIRRHCAGSSVQRCPLSADHVACVHRNNLRDCNVVHAFESNRFVIGARMNRR